MPSHTMSRRGFIGAAGGASLLPLIKGRRGRCAPVRRPNILFIPVDDLRPQLGCHGHARMHSPAIDRLASRGIVFTRTFCQVPVCGASRASLLSGIRPTRNRFIDFYTRLDEDVPGAFTLPRHFRDHGYHTVSNGKVFHHTGDSPGSWTEKPWRPKGDWAGRGYITGENMRIARSTDYGGRGPAYERADVPDNAYPDGVIADKAIADLRRLAAGDAPFFLACGFMKPHLPFCAPTSYWDLYRREDIDLADNPFRPKDAPDAALHNWGELRNYVGIPAEGPLSDDMARTLIHGYYACVSYTDAQVGRVLDELDRLGIADNTVVILWGDHGWQLGEHGLWCKHSNFENALHSPMIVRAPGMEGGRGCDALTEFVDIFPTLCELAGLPVPAHLQGTSFLPLMEDPSRPWRTASFSRYLDGDSMRTDRYRYTEWSRMRTKVTYMPDRDIYARMLYDHDTDPGENVNLAGLPEHRDLVDRMSTMLAEGWEQHAMPLG